MPEKEKLTGQDGNVFNLLGICSSALQKAGLKEEDTKMTERVFASSSYTEALAIMREYVKVS